MINDLLHRLRLREHRARDNGDYDLAADLLMAIETLTRLDREQAFRPLTEAARRRVENGTP